MFCLKFSDRIFTDDKMGSKDSTSSNPYYTAADPYEIPERSAEAIENMCENEIIAADIYYRMNIPFGIINNTVSGEYRDEIVDLTGAEQTASFIKYLSYVQSVWTSHDPNARSENEDGTVDMDDSYDVTPFIFMVIDCQSETAAADVYMEIAKNMPNNQFAPKYTIDDFQFEIVAGNKVMVCGMMSDSKQKIGISAQDVMNNARNYMQTYDGRYSDKQPSFSSESE